MSDNKVIDRQKYLDRIRGLIQRSSSPVLQEAQSAAMMACALIRKYDFDVADPDEINQLYASETKLKQQLEEKSRVVLTDDEDDDSTVFGGGSGYRPINLNYGFAPTSGVSSGSGYTAAPPKAAPKYQPNTPSTAPMTAPVLINSSVFPGQCKYCKKAYNIGDPIQWQRGTGAWCGKTDCYQNWKNKVPLGHTTVPNFKP